MPLRNDETIHERKVPHHQEAQILLNGWRSCKTDRDKYRFIKGIQKSHPYIAENLCKLISEK